MLEQEEANQPGMAGAAFGFADMGPWQGGQAEFLYVKHINQGREFTSGQYAVFEKHGQDEKRVDYMVRFLAPNIVLTGGDEIIELAPMHDDGGHQVGRVRTAIARNLLGYVIDNLETWSS